MKLVVGEFLKRLQMMPIGMSSIVSNISWLFADKLIRIFLTLAVSVLLARYLGPEQFGRLSYAQNFVVILAAISGMGLDAIVLRELSRREKESNVILGSAFVLKGIGAGLVFLVLLFYTSFGWGGESKEILLIIMSASLFFQGFGLVDVYFQSLVKSKYIVFFSLVAVLFSSLVKVFLIYFEADLFWFAVSMLLDAILQAIAFLFCYRLVLGKSLFFWVFRLDEAFFLFKDSWSLMLAGLAFVIFYSFDFIIIEAVFGEYEVGVYAAAFRFFVIWHFIPGMVVNSFKPSVVKLLGTPAYQRRTELVTGLLLWFAIGVFFVVWIGGDLFIEFAYGQDYAQAAHLLKIMIFSNIFVFFFSCWNTWHVIEGRSLYVMVSNLLAVIIKLILTYFFLEDFGLQGLVYFGVLGIFLSFIILSLGSKKTLLLAINSLLAPFRFLNVKS